MLSLQLVAGGRQIAREIEARGGIEAREVRVDLRLLAEPELADRHARPSGEPGGAKQPDRLAPRHRGAEAGLRLLCPPCIDRGDQRRGEGQLDDRGATGHGVRLV